MKVLLLGKNGQVGHELQHTLPALGRLIALGRQEANLEDLESLNQVLQTHAPDIIVNAAAYTAVDKAASDEATAHKVNAQAVRVLADHARANDALLVHYSTDYVFDGEKVGPYTEQDAPNPQSAYGRSKLAGEDAIRQSGCHALIFRTSWVFSTHGSNFVKTIIQLAKERDNLSIVADQIGAPTSAEFIANITAQAITAWKANALPEGIYNLTASGETTWYALARHVVQQLQSTKVPLTLHADHISPITSAEYASPAKRPKNSLLNTNKLRTTLDVGVPDWTVDIDRIVNRLGHFHT